MFFDWVAFDENGNRTKNSDKASQQAWSQGGRIVAVGFNDGRIRIYMIHPPWMDKETHPIERVDELQDHSGLITAIDWSKKSSVLTRPRLLSASFDGTIRVWKYKRRKWESIRIDATLNEKYEVYQGRVLNFTGRKLLTVTQVSTKISRVYH